MIARKTIFSAEVFSKTDVGTVDQWTTLLQEITRKHSIHTNMPNSNFGCFRFEDRTLNLAWLLEEIKQLLNSAIEYYSDIDPIYQKLSRSPTPTVNFWVNINQPGSRNSFHTHKEDEFSCVYYLQGTDTGALRFTNPANMLGDCNRFSPFTRDFLFYPSDRDLILFPSWVPHEVEPNLSSRERINIAFNFRLS